MAYNKNLIKGGDAIAAGGFGCVFRPPIRCKDSSIPYNSNGVSKLMFKRDTFDEMDEIYKVIPFIDTIPNNEDYFLLNNISSCEAGPLSDSDKVSFDDKCHHLKEAGYSKKNINTKINELALINIPYGGIELGNFWKTLDGASNDTVRNLFGSTNTSVVKLLKGGIKPLNDGGFLHMDVKASNILHREENGSIKTRLIDWGLASETEKKGIPEVVLDRVIQYNIPFSIIMFGKHINKLLPSAIKKFSAPNGLNDKDAGKYELMRTVAYNLYRHSLKSVGEGHNEYIKYLLEKTFSSLVDSNNETVELLFGVDLIVQYITAILMEYLDDDNKFMHDKYFHEVFSKNADIWGLVMSYSPLITNPIDNNNNIWADPLSNGVARIIIKYCFSPEYATKPIPVDKLAIDLLSLNKIVGYNNELKIINITSKTKKTRSVPTSILWSGKRCPKGHRRVRKTKRCARNRK